MRFTLRSVLTLALLRLSSLVPTTYGATTGLTQVRDQVPRSELVHSAAGLSKRSRSRRKRCQPGGAGGNAGGGGGSVNPNHPGVVSLEGLHYRVTRIPEQDTPTETVYRVNSEDGQITIGEFRVSTSQGTVTVDDVDLQQDNRPREEKPMIYQVVMSLWVHTSRQEPSDLRSFYVDNVVEESTVTFLERARVRMEEVNLPTQEYSLRRESTGLERQLYAEFLNTSFGKSALGITAVPQVGKKLSRVDVSPGSSALEDGYNMQFFYESLPPDEPDEADEPDEPAETED